MKKGTSALSVYISLNLIFLISGAAKAAPIDDVRNTLKEWVIVEKTISQEQEAWRQEKELLQGVLSSLNQEERVLRNTIEAAEQDTSRADEERLELISKLDIYQQNADRFNNQLKLFERQAVQLIPRLPILLRDEIGLMINRLYLAESGSYSLSQRAQNLLNLLSSIQEFDSSITVSNDIRTLNSGEEVEVKVLYLGLSRAFYADQDNKIAGTGQPTEGGSEDGWLWVEQTDLASNVNRAINIYENNAAPALIELPLSVKAN